MALTSPKRTISPELAVYIALESFLALIYLAWATGRGHTLRYSLEFNEILGGGLFALPLLAVNYLLFITLTDRRFRGRSVSEQYRQFVGQVVIPFSRRLSTYEALLLSIAAGLGEELLFRGVLQHETGLWFSSILFALLHFGPALSKFYWVVALYFVESLYLGVVSYISLATAVVTHITYDFAALLYLRHMSAGSSASLETPQDLG